MQELWQQYMSLVLFDNIYTILKTIQESLQ